jgi:hypothetical protein
MKYDDGWTHGSTGAQRTHAIALATPAMALLALAILSALALTASADGPGAGDAGPSIEHAIAVPAGTWSGSLLRNATMNDTADFYSFEFPGSSLVEMTATILPASPAFEPVRYYIYDRTGGEVVNFTFSGSGVPARFASLTNQAFPTIRYYLSVEWKGSATAGFTVLYNITLVADGKQDDAGTRGDVGNDSAHAAPLALGESVKGAIGGSLPLWRDDLNVDGVDAYEVTPAAKRFLVLTAKLDSSRADRKRGFDLRITDQAGTILAQKPVLAVGDSVVIKQYSDTSLPLYALILSESESCNYTLTATDEAPPEIDLYISNISVAPPRPIAGRPATISVVFKSTSAAVPATDITAQVFAGTDKLWEGKIAFDATGTARQDVTWTAIYGTTKILVKVDTEDFTPYESNENNNQDSIDVTAHDPGEDGGGDGDHNGNGTDWVWLAAAIVIIIAAIAVAVGYAAMRGRDNPPEGEGEN